MNVSNRYIKNSFFNSAGWVWLVILNIATIPFIVHKLGLDAYGVYVIVLMVLGYFAFLDFGLGDAVIKYFSHYYTLKNFGKMNNIINSILVMYLIIGVVGGCAIFIFTKYFALTLFKIPAALKQPATFCFYLGSLGFLLNLILGVISKIPEAIQRYDISNKNSVITGTLVTLAIVLALIAGSGIRTVVLINFLGSALGIILFYTSAKRLVPELRFNLSFHWADFREVLNFGLFTIFTKFSGLVTESINQLFIGLLLGPAAVTIFNVPFKIISKFTSFIYKLASIVFPVTSELTAQNDTIKLQTVYLRLSKYLFLISSTLFIPVAAYSKEILHFWMGSDFAARGHTVMLLCCAAYFLISLTMVPGLVALGMGKPKFNAYFSFLTAVINIGTIYPFIKLWGINGAALSLFLSSLQAPLAIIIINRNVVKIPFLAYWKFAYGPALLTGILLFALFRYYFSSFMTNLVLFSLLLLASFCLMALNGYLIGLDGPGKKLLREKTSAIFLHIISIIKPGNGNRIPHENSI